MEFLELIEKKRHGTPDFPIEYYFIDKTHPRYVMRAHWHNECELVRVLEGSFTAYLNNVKYELHGGDSLFIQGGCLMQGFPDDAIYECLVFDTAMLKRQRMADSEKYSFESLSSSFSFKNLISKNDVTLTGVIIELFRSVREAGRFYELETVSLLYRLFFEMHSGGFIIQKDESYTDKGLHAVAVILEWIEKNLFEPISLSALSDAVGLSEKYICRIFKRFTSKTVMEYINEQRIENACLMLPKKSITEAAFASGFNDLSYFCKMFKRYKGTSPSKYKSTCIK